MIRVVVKPAAAIAIAAIVIALASCTYWRREDISPATQFAPEQEVRIWSAGRMVAVNHVRILDDSVRGHLIAPAPGCAPCTYTIARPAVDSLKVPQGPGVMGAVITLALVGVGVLILGLSQIKD